MWEWIYLVRMLMVPADPDCELLCGAAPSFLPGVRWQHGSIPHPTGADLLLAEARQGFGCHQRCFASGSVYLLPAAAVLLGAALLPELNWASPAEFLSDWDRTGLGPQHSTHSPPQPPGGIVDLGRFAEKKYKSIVRYKVAFYSFYQNCLYLGNYTKTNTTFL